MQTDFNADNIAGFSTYVAEVVAAIQNSSAVSERTWPTSRRSSSSSGPDSVGVGGNVTEGIMKA